MKIYISLPITGQNIEVVNARATFVARVIEELGHQAVNPLDIPSPEDTYASHIGADIAQLLACDAMILLKGWSVSKGCRLELSCAKIYGKAVYKNLDEIPGEGGV